MNCDSLVNKSTRLHKAGGF